MLEIVLWIFLGLMFGFLIRDVIDAFDKNRKEKEVKEKYAFEAEVRTIIRNWIEIPRIHDKINALAEALGYEDINFKENKDGSRELVAWHYAKKKKSKNKKVSQ
jgi:hypothetical protein